MMMAKIIGEIIKNINSIMKYDNGCPHKPLMRFEVLARQ
jgi:hypothetical protein